MKRSFSAVAAAAVLVLGIAVFFASCGGGGGSDSSTSQSTTTPSSPSTPSTSAPTTSSYGLAIIQLQAGTKTISADRNTAVAIRMTSIMINGRNDRVTGPS